MQSYHEHKSSCRSSYTLHIKPGRRTRGIPSCCAYKHYITYSVGARNKMRQTSNVRTLACACAKVHLTYLWSHESCLYHASPKLWFAALYRSTYHIILCLKHFKWTKALLAHHLDASFLFIPLLCLHVTYHVTRSHQTYIRFGAYAHVFRVSWLKRQ